jgi:hypothetical protein
MQIFEEKHMFNAMLNAIPSKAPYAIRIRGSVLAHPQPSLYQCVKQPPLRRSLI